MATVRDLKERVKKLANANGVGQFTRLSEKHYNFWQKLNRLGARNLDTRPPEKHPDIDATVGLTAREYSGLLKEFLRIHNSR